jgi:hypothetical protein
MYSDKFKLEDKCYILAHLDSDYGDMPLFKKLIATCNLGFPLSTSVTTSLVKGLTEDGIFWVDSTFNSFCKHIQIDEKDLIGNESLFDLFDLSPLEIEA